VSAQAAPADLRHAAPAACVLAELGARCRFEVAALV
jgi:hypothetical protein